MIYDKRMNLQIVTSHCPVRCAETRERHGVGTSADGKAQPRPTLSRSFPYRLESFIESWLYVTEWKSTFKEHAVVTE